MITVKTGKTDVITFPRNLLDRLGLEDGEKVDIKIKNRTIAILKEAEDFFSLEGALKDTDVEARVKELDRDWKKWNPRESL